MIGAIVQGAMGVAQMVGGLTMPKPEIPDYEIPAETYKNMTDAEYWSFQGLGEAQKQQFVEQSSRAGASALASSGSRKGGLGMVSSVAQQEQDSATQLLTMDAQQREKNLETLYRSRDVMAGARDKKFGHDKEKVDYQLKKRDEMLGAGMQSLSMGFGGIASKLSKTLGGQTNEEAIAGAETDADTFGDDPSSIGGSGSGSFGGFTA